MKELVFKSASSIVDIDEEQGIVKGLGSVFGNVDSDNDIIEKGAFTKTILENRSRIKYLYQHRIDKPVGTMKELEETESALSFVAQIALKTSLGRDVFEMIKAGLINENSVGFATVKQQYDQKSGINYIKEVKLYEISAVTLAANPLAFINEVKSGSTESKEELINKYLIERFESLEKLIKSNISDELGLAVEFEIKSLKGLSLREITEPKVIIHSAEEEEARRVKEEELSIYNYLIKNLN
jgi:HK97 family phage prohead protease